MGSLRFCVMVKETEYRKGQTWLVNQTWLKFHSVSWDHRQRHGKRIPYHNTYWRNGHQRHNLHALEMDWTIQTYNQPLAKLWHAKPHKENAKVHSTLVVIFTIWLSSNRLWGPKPSKWGPKPDYNQMYTWNASGTHLTYQWGCLAGLL